MPDLNLANHCDTAFPNYPFLLNCPAIGQDIIKCQNAGRKIMLSLGGASGAYGFTSDTQGHSFAGTIWGMFLGNTSSNLPRPFGNAILDGIDLDIEGGSAVGYGAFVSSIRGLMDADKSKRYLISAAPQCPFPDAYVGPSTSTVLGQAPSAFDFLNVQFYNNYCGFTGGASAITTSFKQWANWAQGVSGNHPKILLGLPGSTTASNSAASFIPIATLGPLLVQLNNSFPGEFCGVMLWDQSNIQLTQSGTYGSSVAQLL